MGFILDTNVAIHLRDGETTITRKVGALDGAISISVVTRIELEGGVYSDPANSSVRRMRLNRLLATVPTLSFEDTAAVAYGQIISSTGFSRRKVLDRMIAAQALVHRATLVTLNPADFSDVPNLTLLAW